MSQTTTTGGGGIGGVPFTEISQRQVGRKLGKRAAFALGYGMLVGRQAPKGMVGAGRFTGGIALEKEREMPDLKITDKKKAVHEKRGDFIHGANWALKYVRDHGFHPGHTLIREAARERFPSTEKRFRSVEVDGMTLTATESGVYFDSRLGIHGIYLSQNEIDALNAVVNSSLSAGEIGGYQIISRTAGVTYKNRLITKQQLEAMLALLIQPTEEVDL